MSTFSLVDKDGASVKGSWVVAISTYDVPPCGSRQGACLETGT